MPPAREAVLKPTAKDQTCFQYGIRGGSGQAILCFSKGRLASVASQIGN